MKKFIALSFALIGWSLGGIAAALEFSRTFEAVRGEAGDARLYFTCSAKKVTSFEVDVNGVWAGSVAVPPARGTNTHVIAFDAAFKAGENTVRAYAKGPVHPEIRDFRVETVRPSAGLETAKWQSAIDAAAAAGGGRVTVPAGRHLTGALMLRSNVELHLEKGAVLEGACGLENYRIWSMPNSEGTWSAIVSGIGVTNVAITGEGEIYGNGSAWPLPQRSSANQEGQRARGLFFADSKNVRLEDFLLRDTACWGCVFKCVDGVTVRRVRIDNHSNYNNDGFDIEASNAVFDSCDVDASDDAFVFKSNDARFVVENVLITNCVARSHCNAYKFGTASHGTMRRVSIVDCRALPPRRDFPSPVDRGRLGARKGQPFWSHRTGYELFPAGCGTSSLVVECVDGGTVEDILFENIELSGAMVPIFIRGGTREGRHNAVLPGDRYILRRITMRNIRGEAAAWTASSVSGVDGCRVSDVTLENIDIVCRGAGADKSKEALRRPVPDVSKCYPEATMFRHILPAYGLYADKVDGLCLRDVRFRLRDGDVDVRPAVVRTKDTTCAEGTGESLRLPTGACITRDRIIGEGGGGSYAPNTLKAYREALDSGFSCTFNLFRSADGEVYATDAMDLYASLRIKSAATNMNWMVGMIRRHEPSVKFAMANDRAFSDLIFMPEMWKDSSLYRKKVDAVYRAMEAAERHIPLS